MSDKPSTTERIIAELRERHEKGLAKYGVTVDRTDLTPSQWGQHLKEELLDASQYVQRLIDTASEQEARIKVLEEQVEANVWKTSPAMAQATIDAQAKRSESLEAYVGRLEAAGDEMRYRLSTWKISNGDYVLDQDRIAVENWNKAKESKP